MCPPRHFSYAFRPTTTSHHRRSLRLTLRRTGKARTPHSPTPRAAAAAFATQGSVSPVRASALPSEPCCNLPRLHSLLFCSSGAGRRRRHHHLCQSSPADASRLAAACRPCRPQRALLRRRRRAVRPQPHVSDGAPPFPPTFPWRACLGASVAAARSAAGSLHPRRLALSPRSRSTNSRSWASSARTRT